MSQKIKLTREDWIEISESIAIKIEQIGDGFYGCEEEAGDDAAWQADLQSILTRIGKQGEIACKNGVLAEKESPRGKSKRAKIIQLHEITAN